MYKFNNTNIFTGYIKQLLYSFNLPQCKVFSSEEECLSYFEEIKINNYILAIIKNYKDNKDCIVKIDSNKEIFVIDYYIFNRRYLNLTKNLRLDNLIYDSYTHKYLGDYLRFIRDYKNIDLMSMYNCYIDKIEEDKTYKYIYIPVKYNSKYTLVYNSSKLTNYIFTIENDFNTISKLFDSANTLGVTTYSDKNLIESPLASSDYDLNKETELKLILRIDKTTSTSIIMLEGDFSYAKSYYTNYQFNFDELDSYNDPNFELLRSNLQLLNPLYMSTNENYPFADRLIEYLISNVITPDDTISRDIIDFKYKVREKYEGKKKSQIGRLRATFDKSESIRLLDAFNKNTLLDKNTFDIIGYVDKDIEAVLDDERYPKLGGNE